MNYLEGALEISADRIREEHSRPLLVSLFDAGNSRFSLDNLRDSVTDKSYYAPRVSLYKRWAELEPIAEPWVEEVCDCDSRSTCFCADAIRFGRRRNWKRGFAIFEYWYDSKTLGAGHVRLDGYHATPVCWCISDDGRELVPVVTQPKTLLIRLDGSEATTLPTFQTIEQEFRFWVFMVGKV